MATTTFTFGTTPVPFSHAFFLSTSRLSIAFVNLRPVLSGHILLSPLRPVARFADLTTDEVHDLWSCAQQIGSVVERAYEAEGLTFLMQDGPAAGQTVPHCHVHIIPRKPHDFADPDDLYKLLEGRQEDIRSQEEMDKEATQLRALFPKTNHPSSEEV